MSKSILVVDTPNSCSECDFAKIQNTPSASEYVFRCINKKCYTSQTKYHTERREKCPLQDATELSEGYQLSKKEVYSINGLEIRCSVVINNVHHRVTKETYEILNKLYKAIGGNDADN